MISEEDWTQLPVFSLNEPSDAADHLAALIAAGTKRGICYPFDEHLRLGSPLPQPGTNRLVVYSNGQAACVIQTSYVEVKRFKDVNKVFAEAEGEGDLSLDHWRRIREARFRRMGVFSPEMLLVCHRFRLIKAFSGD